MLFIVSMINTNILKGNIGFVDNENAQASGHCSAELCSIGDYWFSGRAKQMSMRVAEEDKLR